MRYKEAPYPGLDRRAKARRSTPLRQPSDPKRPRMLLLATPPPTSPALFWPCPSLGRPSHALSWFLLHFIQPTILDVQPLTRLTTSLVRKQRCPARQRCHWLIRCQSSLTAPLPAPAVARAEVGEGG